MPNGFSGGPSLDYSGSDYLSDQAGWWPGSSSDTSSESGSAGIQLGDVLEVVGFGVGQVVEIIGGIARIQNEGGEVVEVVVPPSPPAPPPVVVSPPMNWTPVLIGGGLLLALVLALGRR